ncbi:MAG: hypothetical protein KUG81_02260, partial [Gammaproteobacteria bacterium]|nr:hypothetical protein [Gammaproteobacteria bacterium]
MKLSSSAQSLITKKSDASLPGYGKGSPPYVSGYPVPELSAYALAKTWPAPEMPRPGCVWTHTILIGYSDVARLESIFSLLDVFCRPKEKGTFNSYLDEVCFSNQKNTTLIDKNVQTL